MSEVSHTNGNAKISVGKKVVTTKKPKKVEAKKVAKKEEPSSRRSAFDGPRISYEPSAAQSGPAQYQG